MKFLNMLLVFTLLFALSCKNGSVGQQPVESKPEVSVPAEQPKEEPKEECDDCETEIAEGHGASAPIGPEYPIKDAKKVFTVKIRQTNYTEKQILKLNEAEKLLAQVMNSDEFKADIQKMKPFTYLKGPKAGMSNLQVYENLFEGAEALLPAVNYQMDLTVTMYYDRWTKVIGWTNPSIMVVNTNSKYHNGYKPCDIAGNLFHEWTHKMGYDHASATDYGSVPYALGYLMESHCTKLAK